MAAALALLSFLVIIWTRVAAVSRPGAASPLPIAAATMSAACIAVGSLLQALIPGSMIFNSLPEPSPGIIRVFSEAAGPLILVGGMLALALAVASLTLQARAAGAFGKGMTIFSLIVAVLTVFSFQFFPVLAPLIWAVTVSVVLIRRRHWFARHNGERDHYAARGRWGEPGRVVPGRPRGTSNLLAARRLAVITAAVADAQRDRPRGQ